VNEEVTEVESVPEEEPTSVEVRFDICDTDLEPEFPVDQGKPRLHLTLPYVLKSVLHLYYCFIALSDRGCYYITILDTSISSLLLFLFENA
jgi:hypothetical protein